MFSDIKILAYKQQILKIYIHDYLKKYAANYNKQLN